MPNIPRHMWEQGMKEGKAVADSVLALQKRLKKYVARKPDDLPTDREMTLAAAMNISWDYRLAKEASDAARILTWTRLEEFIVARMEPTEKDERLLRQIRRLKNGEAANGFLRMWFHIERFLANGSKEEFWKTYPNPTDAVKALVQDLGVLANMNEGEERDGEEEPTESNGSGSPEGQEGAEGVSPEAQPGPDPGAREERGQDRDGTEGEGGGLQSGGGCVEGPQSQPQVGGEEPQREP